MNGLEAVEMKLSEVKEENIDLRLDAEYFKKSELSLLKLLREKSFDKIGGFAYVTDGIHTSIDYSDSSGINLISATSPRENFFDLTRNVFISEISHKENYRTALKENDIIISTVGTIGNCAVVDKTILPANSDRHVGILRLNEEYKPYFVSTFLLSKFGKFQTFRESTGNVQLNLFIYKIRTIVLPRLSLKFQIHIQDIVLTGLNALKESKSFYKQAETLLLDELGLHNWQPTKANTEVKSFKNSFLQSGRLDAEYYQPKFDELFEKLEATGRSIPLGELLTYNQRGTQPVYTETEDGLPVLNSKHIRKNRIDFVGNRNACREFASKNSIIKKGDVLINGTGVGTIGRAAPYLLDSESLPDNHVTILRSDSIDPVFLSVMLNSVIGNMQVDKFYKGSSGQIELYPNDIAAFTVWNAPTEVQQSIRNCIEEANQLEQHSQHLLQVAKQAVEIAIEQSEEAAIVFIITQTS